MPVIQQQGGVKTVKGLPERWGRKAAKELAALAPGRPCLLAAQFCTAPVMLQTQEYVDLCELLDKVTNGPIPVDATYARICVMAATYAADCGAAVTLAAVKSVPAPVDVAAPGDGCGPRAQLPKGTCLKPREAMEQVCRVRGVEVPEAKLADEQAMRRMTDAAWWRKRLLTMHARTMEHAAIRLGFVSIKAGSYCSTETLRRRQAQNARNEAMLRAQILQNQNQEKFSLYDLAARGMANKSNRKGELMVRMAGCEDIARELGHVGLFVTLTCPSKYHAVLAKSGQFNPKYRNATPREANAYLNAVWARVRAANDRLGILPYGFRIAEPHHDGCPHWHMLVFLPRGQVDNFKMNLEIYGCAEDAHELDTPKAKEARLKVIEIDPAQGTAAGYIAKYVGKNINDEGAAFDEEGAAMLDDENGERPANAWERVDAWASTWGIRQFQGLGMPPVSVWRELRRVKEAADAAPAYVLAALDACRRRTCTLAANWTDKPAIIKGADFAAYIRAQGGVNMGRMYRIGVAMERDRDVPGVLNSVVMDRYGAEVDKARPVGVYARQAPHLAVSLSTRYTWTRKGRVPLAVGVEVDFDGPWSPLNNCTEYGYSDRNAVPRWAEGPVSPLWWTPEGVQSLPEMPIFTDDDRQILPPEWQTVDIDWWTSDEYKKIAQAADSAAWEFIEQERSAANARLSGGWLFNERANTWEKPDARAYENRILESIRARGGVSA